MKNLKEIIRNNKSRIVPVAFAVPTLDLAEAGKQKVQITIKGTGFLVSDKGYVCTCDHLLREGQGQLMVGLKRNGEYAFAPSKIVIEDKERDIAIIQCPQPKPEEHIAISSVSLGDSSKIEEGDEVLFVGFPFGGVAGGGFAPSATRGIISAFRPREIGSASIPFFQIDALTLEGNSGAPLFNEDQEVIGVINARFDPLMSGNQPQVIIGGRPLGMSTNIGFAIPIGLVRPLIDAALNKET